MGGIVQDRGVMVEQLHANSAEECGARCNEQKECGTILFCNFGTKTIGKNCYLHKKKLLGSEPVENMPKCFSYYETCTLGINVMDKQPNNNFFTTK